MLTNRGLPWQPLLTEVVASFDCDPGECINLAEATAATSTLTRMPWMEYANACSPYAIQQCAAQHMLHTEHTWHAPVDANPSTGTGHPPRPSLLQWLLNLVKQVLVLKRLWVNVVRSSELHIWQMCSDADCRTFCTDVNTLMREGTALGVGQGTELWEPDTAWWWTWKNIFWIEGVVGISATSPGSQFVYFTGPLEHLERSAGALETWEQVAQRASRMVWIVQPGDDPVVLPCIANIQPVAERIVLVAAPKSRSDWVETLSAQAQTGFGWWAFRGNAEHTDHLERRFRRRKRKWRVDAPPVQQPVWWFVWVPQGLRASAMPSFFDIHLYISSLSVRSKQDRGTWATWAMPPQEYVSTLGKGYMRAMYRNTMHASTSYRKILYHDFQRLALGRSQYQALAEHLQEAQVQLRWAPHTWIRRILGLSRAIHTPRVCSVHCIQQH